MDSFTTETDKAYANKLQRRVNFKVFVFFMALGCLCIFISWGVFLLFEFCALLGSLLFMFSKNGKAKYWRMDFSNNDLAITNLKSGEVVFIEVLEAEDFVISQNEEETQKDLCGVMIKGTTFIFVGIQRCTELKQYINMHYNL